jgi:hypothetical protein
MKNILLTIFISLFFIDTQVQAQNAYCDSIYLNSVSIDGNMLNVSVFNTSQLFIAYPFFTINLDSNNYILLNDSVNVLSFLSIVGDANNGYSTASYLGNIIDDSLVPLNTNFTGTIKITDPNDSTFNCVYSFMFVYGTMITSVQSSINVNKAIIYPNPASNRLYINLNTDIVNNFYNIVDYTGRTITSGHLNDKLNSIDISELSSGTYYLKVIANEPIISKIIIVKK